MIVLHAWWSIQRDPRGQLILWAEDSEAPSEPPVRRGRRPAIQAHPFAVSAQSLGAMTAHDGAPGTAVLVMPSQGKGPSASAEVHRTREPSPIIRIYSMSEIGNVFAGSECLQHLQGFPYDNRFFAVQQARISISLKCFVGSDQFP